MEGGAGRHDRLAIEGGAPVRATYLPYGRQTVTDEDVASVVAVLRSDFLTTGPAIPRFEAEVARVAGTRHAVAVSNGTAGLDLMLRALGLERGAEVITTPLTFVASANAALYNGLRPVFADIDPQTLNIDPRSVAERITPRTKAILGVHFAGLPFEADAMAELSRDHGVVLLEDAAHALGATLRGRPVGSLGAAAEFSFHPVKHVATGEGGAVTTDDEGLAARVRLLRSHGIAIDASKRSGTTAGHYYEMTELGHNFRLTDMQAALGVSQMARLKPNLARREQIAASYRKALPAGFEHQAPRPGFGHAYHLFVVQLAEGAWRVDRDTVFRALRAENIGVNVHYPPVHLHPYYRTALGTRRGLCPHAEAVYERVLSLPMFHGMTDKDVEDVLAACAKVAARYGA